MNSDISDKKTYTREELCSGNWLATRGFEVFEKLEEYQSNLIKRLKRASSALEGAGIPYGVVGGNAVAAWVASADESAVRSTQDVDILLRRTDLDAAKVALETVGLLFRHAAGLDFFIDGPTGKAREGVHIVFAGEIVRPEYTIPAPEITEVEFSPKGYFITTLNAIVRMKLTSHRLKDRVHLQDMLSVGLIDSSWLETLPPQLSERLRHLLENPEE